MNTHQTEQSDKWTKNLQNKLWHMWKKIQNRPWFTQKGFKSIIHIFYKDKTPYTKSALLDDPTRDNQHLFLETLDRKVGCIFTFVFFLITKYSPMANGPWFETRWMMNPPSTFPHLTLSLLFLLTTTQSPYC